MSGTDETINFTDGRTADSDFSVFMHKFDCFSFLRILFLGPEEKKISISAAKVVVIVSCVVRFDSFRL